MVDLRILKSHGVSTEAWKEIFTSKKIQEKPKLWIERIQQRIQSGLDFCFAHYRFPYAIDQAFDCSFRQLSPTLAQAIANKQSDNTKASSGSDEQALKMAMEWGLTHLITERKDPKTGKVLPGKQFNLPVFWHVIVPLAPAYLMIRVTKQVNDRNRDPYLRFDPFRDTEEDRLRCRVITDWIRVMSKNYGYQHVGNQAVLKAAMYGDQLMFPQSEWHEEKQLQYVDGKEEKRIVREGIPYYFPHPSRTYWDRAYAAPSINTDTGCQWAGNWRVQRAGDVRNDPKIWNKDQLRFPSRDLRAAFPNFFATVYSACQMQFPQSCPLFASLNREQNVQDNFYNTAFDDYALVLTDHFERVIPSEFGLGDYDFPIWARVQMANDLTPIYATPLPSIAPIYFGYSPEDGRLLGTSLLLELLWVQDHVSNLMTQTLLSVKQNLANFTFVNEDVVDEESIRKIENLNEAQYRGLNLFRYSDYKFRMGQNDRKFESIQLPKHDTNQLIYVINSLLGLAERVNVISAQEMGAQATHEQSKAEILQTSGGSSNKAAYFAFQIDKGFEAWKTQLYNYSMAYADEDVWVEIPSQELLSKERLEKLGFTIDESSSPTTDGKVMLKVKKSALALQMFASPSMESERLNDGAMASGMVNLLGMALKEQIIVGSIGKHQAVGLFNQVLRKFGFPEDFKLKVVIDQQAEAAQQAQAFQQQFQGLMQEVQQFVQKNNEEIVKGISESIKPVAEAATTALKASADNKQKLGDLFELFNNLSATIAPLNQPQQMAPLLPPIQDAIIPATVESYGNPAPQELAPIV